MIFFHVLNVLMVGTLSLMKKVIESSSSSEGETSLYEELLFLSTAERHSKIKNYMELVVPRYNDIDFKSHFRLTRPVVEMVLRDLQLQAVKINVTKPSVTPQHAFLLTLWVLANQESFRCVADRFGLSRGHAHTVFIHTVKWMYKARNRYIKWPQSLRQTVVNFTALRANLFPNVVGCVDGTHVLISRPRKDDSYYNRKGTHSMLIQAVCKADMTFTDIYCGWPGSTHDARIWKESPLYNKLKNNLIGEEFHLLGDTAYPLDTFILVPYKDNGHLTIRQKRYNQVLSSTRVVIEQAFGRLKGLWRRLKYLNLQNLSYFKYIVLASCMLHNICIQENIDLEDIDLDIDKDNQGLANVDVGGNLGANDAAKRKRDQIAEELDNIID